MTTGLATDEECHTALATCGWDVEPAIRYLQVEQLFRLGGESRAACHNLLETLNWNMELASSVVIDGIKSRRKKPCESRV